MTDASEFAAMIDGSVAEDSNLDLHQVKFCSRESRSGDHPSDEIHFS